MNYKQPFCIFACICLALTTAQGQWINQASDTLLRVYETVFMLDGQTGWIGGDYGSILKTTDGGDSWFLQRSTSLQFDDVSKIIFTDKSRGFCLASTNLYPSLFTTTDGGSTWSVDSSLFTLMSDSLVSPTQLSVTKTGDSVLVSVYCLGISGLPPARVDVFFSAVFSARPGRSATIRLWETTIFWRKPTLPSGPMWS